MKTNNNKKTNCLLFLLKNDQHIKPLLLFSLGLSRISEVSSPDIHHQLDDQTFRNENGRNVICSVKSKSNYFGNRKTIQWRWEIIHL